MTSPCSGQMACGASARCSAAAVGPSAADSESASASARDALQRLCSWLGTRGLPRGKLAPTLPANVPGRQAFRSGRRAALTLALVPALAAPLTAMANGAFPDAFQVMLPEDAPDRLYVGTNFGVLVSDDGGLRWTLACEAAVGPLGSLYSLGWAPGQLFAATLDGVARSEDGACGWTTGALEGRTPTDVFVDRAGRRVLALTAGGGTVPMSIWISTDAAATFSRAHDAPAGAFLTSVESAQSLPSRLYAAELHHDPAAHPYLLRSDDSGASWSRVDLRPRIGEFLVRIAAVDPADPDRLFLRAEGPSGKDALLISEDGGGTLRTARTLDAAMSAFLLRGNGEILVAAISGEAWISRDRGATFERRAWPHVRGLGERGGIVYAATNEALDGFALASSDDGGETWLPVMDLRHLCGVLSCGSLPGTCAEAWDTLSRTLNIAADACDHLPVRTKWAPPSSCGGCDASGGGLGAALLLWTGLRPWRRRRP